MTIDEAIEYLRKMYQLACETEHTKHNLSWALFQTWAKEDREITNLLYSARGKRKEEE